MNKNRRILIISAHADDHVICAGSVFKLQDQGYQVYEAVLTDSREGNHWQKKKYLTQHEEVIKLRSSEFDQASLFLNLKGKYLLKEEDLNLPFSKEIILKLVKIIREIRPAIIFTLNEEDYHKDHATTAKLVKEASLWAANSLRPELGKAHRTSVVLYAEAFTLIEPDVLIDITGYEKKKMTLFKIYQSQADIDSISLLQNLIKIRGYHLRIKNSKFAEGFVLNKKLPNILFSF